MTTIFPSILILKVKSKKVKKTNFYSACKVFRYSPCVTRGSYSFTCHPHTKYTCLYSPVARRHYCLAGTHCSYTQRDGQAEFTCAALSY